MIEVELSAASNVYKYRVKDYDEFEECIERDLLDEFRIMYTNPNTKDVTEVDNENMWNHVTDGKKFIKLDIVPNEHTLLPTPVTRTESDRIFDFPNYGNAQNGIDMRNQFLLDVYGPKYNMESMYTPFTYNQNEQDLSILSESKVSFCSNCRKEEVFCSKCINSVLKKTAFNDIVTYVDKIFSFLESEVSDSVRVNKDYIGHKFNEMTNQLEKVNGEDNNEHEQQDDEFLHEEDELSIEMDDYEYDKHIKNAHRKLKLRKSRSKSKIERQNSLKDKQAAKSQVSPEKSRPSQAQNQGLNYKDSKIFVSSEANTESGSMGNKAELDLRKSPLVNGENREISSSWSIPKQGGEDESLSNRTCDSCGMKPITSSVYRCNDCEGYDLCYVCYNNHDKTHSVEELKQENLAQSQIYKSVTSCLGPSGISRFQKQQNTKILEYFVKPAAEIQVTPEVIVIILLVENTSTDFFPNDTAVWGKSLGVDQKTSLALGSLAPSKSVQIAVTVFKRDLSLVRGETILDFEVKSQQNSKQVSFMPFSLKLVYKRDELNWSFEIINREPPRQLANNPKESILSKLTNWTISTKR